MYRTVGDFLTDWNDSMNRTLQVLEALTDEKLDQSIVEGHSTLGWIGWHIVTSTEFFGKLVGLEINSPGDETVVPKKASIIVEQFKAVANDLYQAVETNLTDEKMLEKIDNFGTMSPRGAVLRIHIDHHTHHRGQMTVLLRQANLKVPGVMGPTKEEQYY